MGQQHGYAIAARLERVSSGAVQLHMGTLYPGLVRLEARGWISARWGANGFESEHPLVRPHDEGSNSSRKSAPSGTAWRESWPNYWSSAMRS
jgi:hypothetical protein